MSIFLAEYCLAARAADGGQDQLFMDAWLSWDASQPGGLKEHGRCYYDLDHKPCTAPCPADVLWYAQRP